MNDLTLRQLEYLVAIAETGSLTAAAARCHVTQAAVSLALAQLEQTLGATLMIRRRGVGVALTAEGSAVASHARTVVDGAARVASIVSRVRGRLSGRLTVGVYRTLSMHTIPPLIDWFTARHPDVSLEFVEGSGPYVQDAMLAGRVHVAFVYRAQLLPACRSELVHDARRMAVLSPEHPLAARDRIDLRSLAEFPAILLDEEPALARTLAEFAAVGVEPLVPWRSSSVQTIQNVVARNRAYSILMQTASLSPEGGPLVFRELEGAGFANPAVAALPAEVGPSLIVAEAIDAVRSSWAERESALR